MSSPSELMTAIATWLTEKVRVDEITVNPPVNTKTLINEVLYPANTMRVMPPKGIAIDRSDPDNAIGSYFQEYEILYRFSSETPATELPVDHAHNLVSNLYFYAVLEIGKIEESLIRLTPSQDDSVFVGRIEDESQDWIISVRLGFEVVFAVDIGDVSKLQPDGFEIPEQAYTVYFKLNRSYYPITPEDPNTHTLFTTITANTEPPGN